MASASPIAEQSALRVTNKGLLTIGVMLAMIMQILDSTIANVALPHMQASLGATFDSISWVLTSYIIAAAVAIPITGWLADTIGSRRLFLFSVGAFIVTSMLCGIATNLPEMVLFRFLQRVAGSFIGPLSQTVMLDINKPSEQPRAMAMWTMGIMIGPIMGPIIGGWLTENYNWRWVFYVNLPVGLIAFGLIWWLLPSRPLARRSFDLFGFSMLALALSALQLMLDRGNDRDWFHSTEIWIEAFLAVSAAWIFLVHLATGRKSLLDRELVRNTNMLMSLGFMLVVGLMMMSVMALMPPLLQKVYGYDVLDTGLLLVPRGVGILISMFVASRLIGRVDPRIPIIGGLLIAAFSLWQMTQWSIIIGWPPLVVSGLIQGLGMGLCFVPANSIAFATLAPRYRTEGASLLNLFRNMGGSVGISIVTTVLARNVQVSHEDLSSHVTAFNMSSVDPSTADRYAGIGQAGLAMVDAEINRQALMIAYLDDFKLIMIISFCAIPLIMMLRPPAKGATPQSGAEAAEAMGH